MELLEPKEMEINGITYRIGKYPAIAGREIISKYPLSNMPKIGDYQTSEEIMLKVMSFIERVQSDGTAIRLTTRTLVDNHIKDWETLVKLEMASLEYNCSFFQNGKASAFLRKSLNLAEQKIIETLTGLLGQLSVKAAQPTTNSKQA